MAEMPPEDERVPGFALDLRDGVELMCSYVPGHRNPYLGIRKGNQFVALARFISDKEMEFLGDVLKSRLFVIQPLDEV